MSVFVIGCILFAFPFLLIFLEEDCLLGALKVSAGLIGFTAFTALVTQALHIFVYPVVISAFILADLCVAWAIYRKASTFKEELRKAGKPSTLVVFLLVLITFAIIGFEFYSVHYKYTGDVETLRGTSHVSESSYGYPLFSDEWVYAAFARQSLASHSLSLNDPFRKEQPIANLLTPFQATLDEAFLITGLDPVSQFAVLAILTGLLVLGAFYICVRAFGAGLVSSLITVLMASLLAQAANLPGLWFLLPYLAACIPFLLSLASFAKKDHMLGCVHALLAVVLYPPLIVFLAPAALVALFTDQNKPLQKPIAIARRHVSTVSIVAICILGLVSFLIAILPSPVRSLFIENAARGIYHKNFEDGLISFPLCDIFPYILIPFALIGTFVKPIRNKLFFLITLVIGLSYWIAYAFYEGVVIIEYPRIVVITSFLLLIAAGLGIEFVLNFLYTRFLVRGRPRLIINACAIVGLLGASLLIAPVYSRVVLRGEFPLSAHSGKNTVLLIPLAAITRYLTPDDLAIWNAISGKNFTAPPWKALVVGAATGNFPLETKPSFLTEKVVAYDDFMKADCPDKSSLASHFRISYAYSDPFSCPKFSAVATSSEGLVLYLYTH